MFTFQYLLLSRAGFEEKIWTPFALPKFAQLTESAVAKILKGPVGTRNHLLVDAIEPEAAKIENCPLADHNLLGNDKITQMKYMTDPEPTEALTLTDHKPVHKNILSHAGTGVGENSHVTDDDQSQMRKHHEPVMATCMCRRRACV